MGDRIAHLESGQLGICCRPLLERREFPCTDGHCGQKPLHENSDMAKRGFQKNQSRSQRMLDNVGGRDLEPGLACLTRLVVDVDKFLRSSAAVSAAGV